MTTTHWFLVGGLLMLGGLLAAGWLGVQFARAPYLPDQRSSFDEHAATAAAVLQPDDPTLPDVPRLSFIEQVEAYVALHAPKESDR